MSGHRDSVLLIEHRVFSEHAICRRRTKRNQGAARRDAVDPLPKESAGDPFTHAKPRDCRPHRSDFTGTVR